MVGEVFAGVTAFNAMLSAAKALRDMDNAVSRNSAIIDLQGQILAAQEDYAKLRETVGKLEEKLASFETWESEKQRYVLKEHGEKPVLAYALKEGVEPPEHPHSICPDCYQQRKKSLLQTVHHVVGHAESLKCQVCGWEAYTRGHKRLEHSALRRR